MEARVSCETVFDPRGFQSHQFREGRDCVWKLILLWSLDLADWIFRGGHSLPFLTPFSASIAVNYSAALRTGAAAGASRLCFFKISWRRETGSAGTVLPSIPVMVSAAISAFTIASSVAFTVA